MRSVGLFVTCLVDQFLPSAGEASASLLEACGYEVAFPSAQTCCGQPAFNLGHRDAARPLVERWIEVFEPCEAVVTPSGSCASMLRVFAPGLLADAPAWHRRARSLAERVFELSEFLDARGFVPSRPVPRRVAYHPSCHLLRELGIDAAPRRLLSRVPELELAPLGSDARCCGFGGAFSVAFPELSAAIADDVLGAVEASGAELVTASDAGCLVHMGGALHRRGSRVRAVHLAEVLAGGV
jgi:L-lactate dehydrogenase complex protein LldE